MAMRFPNRNIEDALIEAKNMILGKTAIRNVAEILSC